MAKANLSGEAPEGQYEKVLIAEDVYQGYLEEVEPQTKEMGSEKFGRKPKMILRWNIDGKQIPQYVSPVVTKGSGSFQSSNCFILIDKAGELDHFAETLPDGEFPDEDLIKFIKDNIVDKPAKLLVRNTRGESPYSVVKEVVNFATQTSLKPVVGDVVGATVEKKKVE